MKIVRSHVPVCERARAYVSLELDSELSQLERAMLAAHVARCEPCAEFERNVRAQTEELRRAPLERLPRPVELPARRRPVLRHLHAAAAAAAAFVLAGLGAAVLDQTAAERRASRSVEPPTVFHNDVASELRFVLATRPGLTSYDGPAKRI